MRQPVLSVQEKDSLGPSVKSETASGAGCRCPERPRTRLQLLAFQAPAPFSRFLNV